MSIRISAAALAAVVGASLGGCATITHGSSQDIAITSDPPGARCEVYRRGDYVATLDKTPGVVNVDKSKYDILITCALPGYEEARANLKSTTEGEAAGSALLGGVIGMGVDEVTGATNKYPTSAHLTLIPAKTSAPDVATAPPPPAPPAVQQPVTETYEGEDKAGNSVSITVVATPSGKQILSLAYRLTNCVSVQSVTTSENAPFGQFKNDTIIFPFTVLAGMQIPDVTSQHVNALMNEYDAVAHLAGKRPHLTLSGLRLISVENPAKQLSGINFFPPGPGGICKLPKRFDFDLTRR